MTDLWGGIPQCPAMPDDKVRGTRGIPALRAPIPLRLNLALCAAFTALQGLCLVVLPVNTAWAWLLLPSTLLTNPQWTLMHEALHGHLHPRPHTNERLGRLLHVGFGLSFHLVRYGHLAHHRFNRFPLDRPEIYDPAPGAWWRRVADVPWNQSIQSRPASWPGVSTSSRYSSCRSRKWMRSGGWSARKPRRPSGQSPARIAGTR